MVNSLNLCEYYDILIKTIIEVLIFYSGKAHEALLQYEQGLDSNTDTDHLRYCNEGIARCLIKCGNAKKGIDIALDIGSKKLLKECAELLENTKV